MSTVTTSVGRLSLDEKLFTVRRKPVSQPHITLDEELCRECGKRTCTYICPAGVYEWREAEGRVHVAYENCLECGACRVACGMSSIEWSNPAWGEGVAYKVS